MKKEYLMWTDGVFTLFGVKLGKDGDTYTVADPVTVVPTTEQEALDDKGTSRSIMRFEITPLVFRAVLKNQEANIWKVKPTYVLDSAEFEDGLISQYEYIVKATERLAGTLSDSAVNKDAELITK